MKAHNTTRKFIQGTLLLTGILINVATFAGTHNQNKPSPCHLGMGFAMASLTINKEYAFLNIEENVGQLGANVFVKCRQDFLFVQLSGIPSTDISLGISDSYQYYDIRALAGVRLPINRNLAIDLMRGVSHWEIHMKEGRLFNPGPEEFRQFQGHNPVNAIRINFLRQSRNNYFLSYAESKSYIGTEKLWIIGFEKK